MILTKINGLRAIERRILANQVRMRRVVVSGLKVGGLLLQRESQKIVPIDKNVLRPSAFTREFPPGSGTIRVGYDTEYAVYVHEDLNARHKKGKRAKYLEEPARTKRKEILDAVRDHIRKKMK